MDCGRFVHSIILRSPGGVRDAVGERSTTWTNVATVYASINPLTARELFLAGQQQMNVTHKIMIQYDSTIAAIDNDWTVLFGSRVFVITGIRNINEMNEMVELLCSEGLRDE